MSGLNTDELIQRIKKNGVPSSKTTLWRFVKSGLISEPVRGNKGRGKGKTATYSIEAVGEYIASWKLLKLNGASVEEVKEARKLALKSAIYKSFEKYNDDKVLWILWWGEMQKALEGG